MPLYHSTMMVICHCASLATPIGPATQQSSLARACRLADDHHASQYRYGVSNPGCLAENQVDYHYPIPAGAGLDRRLTPGSITMPIQSPMDKVFWRGRDISLLLRLLLEPKVSDRGNDPLLED